MKMKKKWCFVLVIVLLIITCSCLLIGCEVPNNGDDQSDNNSNNENNNNNNNPSVENPALKSLMTFVERFENSKNLTLTLKYSNNEEFTMTVFDNAIKYVVKQHNTQGDLEESIYYYEYADKTLYEYNSKLVEWEGDEAVYAWEKSVRLTPEQMQGLCEEKNTNNAIYAFMLYQYSDTFSIMSGIVEIPKIVKDNEFNLVDGWNVADVVLDDVNTEIKYRLSQEQMDISEKQVYSDGAIFSVEYTYKIGSETITLPEITENV